MKDVNEKVIFSVHSFTMMHFSRMELMCKKNEVVRTMRKHIVKDNQCHKISNHSKSQITVDYAFVGHTLCHLFLYFVGLSI